MNPRTLTLPLRNPLTLTLLLLFASCTPPSAPAPPGEDMALPADPDGGPTMNVEGRIIGLDRQPLPGAQVSLCQGRCRDTVTGARGEYAFAGVGASFYTLRVRMAGHADLDFPLYLGSESYPRLLPLVLPRIDGPGVAVTSGTQTLALDGQLSLSVQGELLSLGAGPVEHLGAARIPEDLFPNFCVPSARVMAMWAFLPTGVRSGAPIPVRLGEGLGLAAGTRVSLITIDPADGRPQVAAQGVVALDGKSIQTEAGAGVTRLSWLLLAVLQGGA